MRAVKPSPIRGLVMCLAFAGSAGACSQRPPPPAREAPPPNAIIAPAASAALQKEVRTLTIIGTNDLHGHVEALPILGGFLRVIREEKGAENVILVDAGDMFQGTLESGLGEGAPVIRGYNALGYDAIAIGNHEFDYGPEGTQKTTAVAAVDDPRGALKARAMQASFPFLSANLIDATSGQMPDWPNLRGHVTILRGGTTIGLVGATTEDTPKTTISANFAGLRMSPLAESIAREAEAARREGATVIVAITHAGGKCEGSEDLAAVNPCDPHEEIMRAIAEMKPGTVDAIVAGHTHARMANVLNDIPVIESFSAGRAFGRIDLELDAKTRNVVGHKIMPTTFLTLPAGYDGRQVSRDAEIDRVLAPDLERTRVRKESSLGVILDAPLTRSYHSESPEGNLFADLMLGAFPAGDVAITNGGGLRADLPAGELRYGELYEAMPFDNRFALAHVHGRELRRLVIANLVNKSGILSFAGMHVTAVCKGRELDVVLTRKNGSTVKDDDAVTIVTSDFLATGGDGSRFPEGSVVATDKVVRDAFEAGLKARGGHLNPADPKLFSTIKPRVSLPMAHPVHCGT